MKYYSYFNTNTNYYVYFNRLTNAPISGFYNVDSDGNAWLGKYEQKYPLYCDSVIEDEFNHSDYYKDRISSEVLELPYDLNDIKVNVNDPVKASIFNNAIEKIYNNMLYIYSNCFIPNNHIPQDMSIWLGRYRTDFKNTSNDDEKFEIHKPTETPYYPPMDFDWRENNDDPINIRLINNIRESVVFHNKNNGFDYLFAITTNDVNTPMADAPYSNRLICLKINIKTGVVQLILNTQFIDDSAEQDIDTISEIGGRIEGLNYSNNLTFGKLNSIASDQQRYIYILDEYNNHIYMYDVYNIINEDKLFKKRLILVNIYGDQDAMGNINYKFILPELVRVINNQIIVFDTGDDSLKLFDKTFNWLGTMNNRNFKNNIPKDIIYNENKNEYYILTKDSYILKYDREFRLIDKIFSGIYLDNDEYCSKFYKSYNNSNICYIATNRRIIKKFITKLDKNIGSYLFRRYHVIREQQDIWNFLNINWDLNKFKWHQYDNPEDDYYIPNIKCMSFVPIDEQEDTIYIVVNSRILYCKDNILYNSLMSNNNSSTLNYYPDFQIYSLDDIYINEKEYVQSLTYNKSLYKLVYSLNLLASKIIFKPIMQYDNYTNILIKEFKYIENELLDNKNIKIYDNENVDYMVVNRIFEKIYNFQYMLLQNIQSKILNTKKSLTTPISLL